MQVITKFVQDQAGNLMPNATGTLYYAGTDQLVTGLQDIDGNALANPMRSDARGMLQFSAPTGNYDLNVRKGSSTYTVRVQVIDVDEAQQAAASASSSANSARADADRAEEAFKEPSELLVSSLGSSTPRQLDERFADAANVLDFGADRTGAVSSSAAFIAAKNYAISNNKKRVIVPAGEYWLDVPGTMSVPPASGATNGFLWDGAGMGVTTIRYHNQLSVGSNFLVSVDNDQLRINFKGIRFNGNPDDKNSEFMYMTSASTAQSFRFWDCMWYQFYQISNIEGTANASEMLYIGCKTSVTYGPAFVTDNVQSLNHVFIGCDLEVAFDDVFYFKRGGHLNMFGGSVIIGGDGQTSGAILHTDDTSGAGIGLNSWNYNFYGVRTEIKDTAKFLEGNSSGFVSLHGCNLETIVGDSSRVIFNMYGGMQVNAYSSSLDGGVYLQALSSTYVLNTRPATFKADGCWFGDSFNWERQHVNNVGGKGRLLFRDCKKSLGEGDSEPLDQYVGWADGSTTFSACKRVAIMHLANRDGGLPRAVDDIKLTLPTDAVVTSIRLYHPSQPGPSSQTYILQNDDGSVVLGSWDISITDTVNESVPMYYQCPDDNSRTLHFLGGAGNDSASYNGYMEIEYIA